MAANASAWRLADSAMAATGFGPQLVTREHGPGFVATDASEQERGEAVTGHNMLD